MSRCWAIHPTHGRCSMAGGHEGDHEVTFTWCDDETWTPNLTVTTTGGADVPIVVLNETPPPPTGKCFACGCSEEAHGGIGDMCDKHQCKTFVP